MKNLSNKILEQIKHEDIKPISRKLFVLQNLGIWISALLSLFLGSISISLLSYNIANKDWDIYQHLHESWFGFLVSSLPYLWIILTVVSLIIAIFNIEHSKRGYRYSPLKIILGSIAISIIIGSAGFVLGFGQELDNYIGQKFPSYPTVDSQKNKTWNQPANGLFSGTIQSTDNNSFSLVDFSGKTWIVDYSSAIIKGDTKIEPGNQIKIIGKTSGQNKITASEIRPWGTIGNGKGRSGFGQGSHNK